MPIFEFEQIVKKRFYIHHQNFEKAKDLVKKAVPYEKTEYPPLFIHEHGKKSGKIKENSRSIVCPYEDIIDYVNESCVYMKDGRWCDDINTNAGNDDAWCRSRIEENMEK